MVNEWYAIVSMVFVFPLLVFDGFNLVNYCIFYVIAKKKCISNLIGIIIVIQLR